MEVTTRKLLVIATVILLLAAMAISVGLGAIADTRNERGPPPLDPKDVRIGREVYLQYCASCHGRRGEGEPNWREPNARGELPAPPHDAEGHTW